MLLLIILAIGCERTQPSPLRVGSSVWPGYEPLFLARQLGQFDHSPIKLVEYQSASEVLEAFYEEQIEVAALTLDEAISLIENGIDLRIVLVMDFSNGADALIAKPDIASIEGLQGKRVAVEFNAVGGLVLTSALETAQLTPRDVNVVHASAGEHLDQFPSVDAVVCFEPTASKLVKQGGRRLFDSRQIPEMIVNVLVVRTQTLISHQSALTALVNGFFVARHNLIEAPEEAYPLINARLNLAPDQMSPVFQRLRLPDAKDNRDLLQQEAPQLLETAAKLTTYMVKKRLLRHEIDLSDLTTAAFIPLTLPE